MEKTTLLDAYLSGPGILRAAVSGISHEQMVSRPVAGRWSVLEVVCHLAGTDANIAHRIKRVLSEEQPVFDRVKPEVMLAALQYHDRDIEEELGVFDLTRRQIGRILRASPPEAWERTGIVGDHAGSSPSARRSSNESALMQSTRFDRTDGGTFVVPRWVRVFLACHSRKCAMASPSSGSVKVYRSGPVARQRPSPRRVSPTTGSPILG
jgi:hypothetical protein